ncbi:MAG: hypothetical protein EOP04_09465 [Proteobacteria bacterium]|nr:MAG: hypothetical protein EOP04_09465 [Pseudomonadota bacterium]
MKTTTVSLSPENRSLARDLWQALYYSSSPTHLVLARQAFEDAPEDVKEMILKTSVQNWQNRDESEIEKNPFE